MAGVALERKGESIAAWQRVQSAARLPHGSGETGERRMKETHRQKYRGNEMAFVLHAEARAPEVGESTASFEAEKQGAASWFARETASAWAACGAFEWGALGYLAA